MEATERCNWYKGKLYKRKCIFIQRLIIKSKLKWKVKLKHLNGKINFTCLNCCSYFASNYSRKVRKILN